MQGVGLDPGTRHGPPGSRCHTSTPSRRPRDRERTTPSPTLPLRCDYGPVYKMSSSDYEYQFCSFLTPFFLVKRVVLHNERRDFRGDHLSRTVVRTTHLDFPDTETLCLSRWTYLRPLRSGRGGKSTTNLFERCTGTQPIESLDVVGRRRFDL